MIKVELLCQKRALQAFSLNPDVWSVNVQPYSGSPANFAVYTGLLQPGEELWDLIYQVVDIYSWLSNKNKKISATSVYFESKPYTVDENGWIDYDNLEKLALEFKPKIIICGASAYPRDFSYVRFRSICDKIGAYLMADIAHISGLVATGEMKSPFNLCDIVTSTTHKTLRGPSSGIIFIKKQHNNTKKINDAVFPGLQGGPHNHQVAALATQLKQVNTQYFKEYIQKVKSNAKYLHKN